MVACVRDAALCVPENFSGNLTDSLSAAPQTREICVPHVRTSLDWYLWDFINCSRNICRLNWHSIPRFSHFLRGNKRSLYNRFIYTVYVNPNVFQMAFPFSSELRFTNKIPTDGLPIYVKQLLAQYCGFESSYPAGRTDLLIVIKSRYKDIG